MAITKWLLLSPQSRTAQSFGLTQLNFKINIIFGGWPIFTLKVNWKKMKKIETEFQFGWHSDKGDRTRRRWMNDETSTLIWWTQHTTKQSKKLCLVLKKQSKNNMDIINVECFCQLDEKRFFTFLHWFQYLGYLQIK